MKALGLVLNTVLGKRNKKISFLLSAFWLQACFCRWSVWSTGHTEKSTTPPSGALAVQVRETARDTSNWRLSDYEKCDSRDINKLVWEHIEIAWGCQAELSQRRWCLHWMLRMTKNISSYRARVGREFFSQKETARTKQRGKNSHPLHVGASTLLWEPSSLLCPCFPPMMIKTLLQYPLPTCFSF